MLQFTILTTVFSGRENQQSDSQLASLNCFAKMLRPSIYFVDENICDFGSVAQAMSRGRWALAHANSNLKIMHAVRLS